MCLSRAAEVGVVSDSNGGGGSAVKRRRVRGGGMRVGRAHVLASQRSRLGGDRRKPLVVAGDALLTPQFSFLIRL